MQTQPQITVTEFVSAFRADKLSPIHLRTFKPRGAPETSENKPRKFVASLENFSSDADLKAEIRNVNKTSGVYFVVNSGGDTDAEIKQVNAFFVENDELSIAEQHAKLDACPLQPSIRVETKKSVHGYWLIPEADKPKIDATAFRAMQTQLVKYFSGDEKCVNPSRVMRLPYFNHVSLNQATGNYQYKPVVLHTFAPERRYTLEQMQAAFSPVVQLTDKRESTTTKKQFEFHEDRNDELKRLIRERGKKVRNGYQMKCPAHDGKGASSLWSPDDSPVVTCRDKCNYFDILPPFGLSNEPLPKRARSEHGVVESNDNETTEIDGEPLEIKLPELSETALYGLAGDFVRTVEPHTESDKSALLVQFLTFFGVITSRTAYFLIEGDKHFTNLFCVIVGNTATGRKGTSLGRVKQVFQGLDVFFEQNCVVGGLASGEGLLYQVRDAVYGEKKNSFGSMETVIIDKGVTDKRLLVVEGEFAQVLRVQGRDGNTLSAHLRNFWDNGTARNLTKNSPLKTTNAHVGIIGHITKDELLICLEEVEAANGYANRFLFACGNRSKLLPFGGDIPENEISCLREEIKLCLNFAGGVDRIQFTPDAARIWAIEYQRLETSRFGYLAKITQRASPYVLRLSCIFALLDKEKFISPPHLEAALAVWQYCEDSARYIFGNQISDKLANKILTLLREAGANGLTKTQIHDLTKHTYDAKRLNAALNTLFENRLARFENITQPNVRKPVEKWFAIVIVSTNAEFAEFAEFNQTKLITSSANSANSDSNCKNDGEREEFEI